MKYRAISRMMETGVRELVFPGAVLLCARGRKILYHDAFGVADLGKQAPVKKNSIFDLASLTKPLATAMAMAELVAAGRVSLDTLLGDVIPGVRDTPKAEITISMLLRHTSGLPAHREFFLPIAKEKRITKKQRKKNQANEKVPEENYNPRQLLRNLILAEPLAAKPGDQQVYSDLGYMFLSWVIEILSKQRIDKFVQEKIYSPLGIQDLFFIDLGKDRPPIAKERWVSTQTCPWRGKTLIGEVEDDNAWAAGGIEGHAGLFGDALSIHVLCCEILNAVKKKNTIVLDPIVFDSFVRKKKGQNLVAGFDTPSKFHASAGRFFSSRTLGHLGFTGTSFWIDPDSEIIAILLTNRVHPSRANQKIKKFRPQIHELMSRALG